VPTSRLDFFFLSPPFSPHCSGLSGDVDFPPIFRREELFPFVLLVLRRFCLVFFFFFSFFFFFLFFFSRIVLFPSCDSFNPAPLGGVIFNQLFFFFFFFGVLGTRRVYTTLLCEGTTWAGKPLRALPHFLFQVVLR